ncbi:MAG: hypothetical protein Q9162_002033 [Coniocarpon cinnabarinum]
MSSSNIFVPIDAGTFPEQISHQGGHPVPKRGIRESAPIQTNKFYANFFLGNQDQGTWTHPYSVTWLRGGSVDPYSACWVKSVGWGLFSWGLAVSHISRERLALGPGQPDESFKIPGSTIPAYAPAEPVRYFINPIGIYSLILSAKELGNQTVLTTDTLRAFSVNVNLTPHSKAYPVITFPIVQGMGFVTAIYNWSTPMIQTGVCFVTLTFTGTVHGTNTARYSVLLADRTQWLLYMTSNENQSCPTLTLVSHSAILANGSFSGCIQVAKNPNRAASQAVYDASAGVYPLRGSVAGMTRNSTGTYQLSWTKGGNPGRTLLMFALPHQQQEMAPSFCTQSRSALRLETTTKGDAAAVLADAWTLTEHELPYDMDFAPWSPLLRSQSAVAPAARHLIQSVSATELAQDMMAQTNLNSMYFSGKGLAKFAFTIFAAARIGEATGIAARGLTQLKNAFATFVNNQQIFPLVYDTVWGGIVSSCTYKNGDPNGDSGNTYYNDHHFHYGYFVYTASVIGHLDPNWLQQGTNKAWVNALVRDYADPVGGDPMFPFSRHFDWYHGHSWAHGLHEAADGKKQESSSEDAFASYAMKMWGYTTGDVNMEARGNLMLAIQARTFRNYYLLQDGDIIGPREFRKNKAAGILFENKIDRTTSFGNNNEYIEGIHMIPLNPSSTLTRTRAFVDEEWRRYFSGRRVDQVEGGWRGILYANLAIVNPVAAYDFFAQPNFDNSWLDAGASRTWYLAFCAALGGAK